MVRRRGFGTLVLALALAWLLGASGTPAQAPTDTPADRFYSAIRDGNLSALQALIQSGADVNLAERRGGATPLMNAAAFGSIDAVRALLDGGANVNARSFGGATALMWAATDLDKVRLLVDRGADVNALSENGRGALMLAASSDRSAPIVRLLLSRGANPRAVDTDKTSTVLAAAQGNDVGTVSELVATGVDVNAPDVTGRTALMTAAALGNLNAVNLLIAKGANVNAVSGPPGIPVKNGTVALGQFTPLILASTYGPNALVKALLAAGAKVNVQDARGMTPLMLAVAADHGDPEIAATLLAAGADVNARDLNGQTALDWARKAGTTPRVALLQRVGAPGATSAATTATAAVRTASTPRLSTRDAVQRGIVLTERVAGSFLGSGGCASCHAQNITDIAVAEAKLAGVRVDVQAATARAQGASGQFGSTATRLLERYDGPAVDILLFTLTALAAEQHPADRATDAMIFNVSAQQSADGAWHAFGISRSPMADGSLPSTAVAIRGLKTYGIPGRRTEMNDRVSRAMAWLRSAKVSTSDDRAFRLLGLLWGGAQPAELRTLAQEMLATARSDGGFAQRAEMTSDPYATGLTLYAVLHAGTSPTDPRVARAVDYLLSTQHDDGSWFVRSRAPKFQPYFDGGFPYEHDQWISSMATGWATAALAATLPRGTTVAAAR